MPNKRPIQEWVYLDKYAKILKLAYAYKIAARNIGETDTGTLPFTSKFAEAAFDPHPENDKELDEVIARLGKMDANKLEVMIEERGIPPSEALKEGINHLEQDRIDANHQFNESQAELLCAQQLLAPDVIDQWTPQQIHEFQKANKKSLNTFYEAREDLSAVNLFTLGMAAEMQKIPLSLQYDISQARKNHFVSAEEMQENQKLRSSINKVTEALEPVPHLTKMDKVQLNISRKFQQMKRAFKNLARTIRNIKNIKQGRGKPGGRGV